MWREQGSRCGKKQVWGEPGGQSLMGLVACQGLSLCPSGIDELFTHPRVADGLEG